MGGGGGGTDLLNYESIWGQFMNWSDGSDGSLFWIILESCALVETGLWGEGVDLLNYESIWGQSMNCVSNFLSGSLF